MRNKARMRRSIPALLLILLGVAAQLAALLALSRVDPLLEYVAPAPEVRREAASEERSARVESGLEARIEAREQVEEALADAVSALSLSALKSGAELSGGGQSVTATLRGVEARWLETCPRALREGRWMDDTELARGAKVAVLDEDLAFALFGSEGALGREVEIEGERYAVIGAARHRRGVGEADGYCAYVPLRAVASQGVQMDVTVMHALSAVSSGLDQSFTSEMRAAWGAGEVHNLRKERMGALLLTRLLACAFALALMIRLVRRYASLARRWMAQIAERRRHTYVNRWLWGALARWMGLVLGASALLAVLYGILRVAIEPVYSFTEWVPESLVSASALRAVFWSRAADAARLISLRTPESARIAFWGAIGRTGAVMMLLGLALGRGRRVKAKKERTGNREEEANV